MKALLDLPRSVRAATWLLPAGQREAVVGDLLESEHVEGDGGGGRGKVWLSIQCVAIGLALRATELRNPELAFGCRDLWRGIWMETARAGRRAVREPKSLIGLGLIVAIAACTAVAAGLMIGTVTAVAPRLPVDGGLAWLIQN